MGKKLDDTAQKTVVNGLYSYLEASKKWSTVRVYVET